MASRQARWLAKNRDRRRTLAAEFAKKTAAKIEPPSPDTIATIKQYLRSAERLRAAGVRLSG